MARNILRKFTKVINIMLKVTLCVGWINYNNRQYTEWYQISLLRDTFFLPKCYVEIKLNWQNFHWPQFHFICQSINYVLSWNNDSYKIVRIIEIKHFIKMGKLWDLCSFKTWMIYYFCGFMFMLTHLLKHSNAQHMHVSCNI